MRQDTPLGKELLSKLTDSVRIKHERASKRETRDDHSAVVEPLTFGAVAGQSSSQLAIGDSDIGTSSRPTTVVDTPQEHVDSPEEIMNGESEHTDPKDDVRHDIQDTSSQRRKSATSGLAITSTAHKPPGHRYSNIHISGEGRVLSGDFYASGQSTVGSIRSSASVAGSLRIQLRPQDSLTDVARLLSGVAVQGDVSIEASRDDPSFGPMHGPIASPNINQAQQQASKHPEHEVNDHPPTQEQYHHHDDAPVMRDENERSEEYDGAAAASDPDWNTFWHHHPTSHGTGAFHDPNNTSVLKDHATEQGTGTDRPTNPLSILDARVSSQSVGVTLPGARGNHQVETVAFLDPGSVGRQANLVSKRFLQEEMGDPPISHTRSLQGLGTAAHEPCGEIELKIWPRSKNPRTGCVELEPPIIQKFVVLDDAEEGREPSFFGDILLGQGYIDRRGRCFNFPFPGTVQKDSRN